MESAFLIQLAASAAAVAALIGLAAWARIARPFEPLDEAAAHRLFAEEFPDHPIDAIWLAGEGALARSGAAALVLSRLGDGYVARRLPWDRALAGPVRNGRLQLDLNDPSAPRAHLTLDDWPPREAG